MPPAKAGTIYRIGLVFTSSTSKIAENRRIPNTDPVRNTPAEYKNNKRAPAIRPPAIPAIIITSKSFPSVRVKPKPATNDAPIINPATAKTNLKILYPKKHMSRPNKTAPASKKFNKMADTFTVFSCNLWFNYCQIEIKHLSNDNSTIQRLHNAYY